MNGAPENHLFRAIRVLVVLSILLTAGCESLQPALQMATDLGVASGGLTQSQADSINRSAVAVGKTFEDITPEQEYYIGRAVAATVLGRYRPYEDEGAVRYVNLVGQTLAQASERPETFGGYHFLILDSPEINAFAAPGGLILVTRGMIRLCKTEDALAAVLAHEISHIQDKHGLRAIKAGRLTSALTVLAAEGARNFGGQELAELTDAFEGSVGDIASTLLEKGYSRELERDADRSALIILQRVGYNPLALTEVLTEMESQVRPGGPGFAKTHPDAGDRIREISQVTDGWAGSPIPPVRAKRFEGTLGRV